MICNIGYYTVNQKDKNGNLKKSFKIWQSMMYRCYSKYVEPNYRNCRVCEEWHCYDNFEKWCDENYYELDNEIVSLDKDLFQNANSDIKIYSPSTCIFVPQRLNSLFLTLNTSQTVEKFIRIKQITQSYQWKIPNKTYSKILEYCDEKIAMEQ